MASAARAPRTSTPRPATARTATARPTTARAATARPPAGRAPVTRTRPVAPTTPRLQVVEGRRQAVRLALVLGATLFALLFAVTAFQTRLAQNQLELDRTDDQISVERERYDQLRLQRAELLAPERLMAEAAALGMVPGSATEFVSVDERLVAQVAVSAGDIDEAQRSAGQDPFADYGDVKATVDGAG